MVIGGKTRGGEAAAAHSEASMAGYCGGRDRSRVSSTSSESLSDGQMTCGGWLSCCFCQRGEENGSLSNQLWNEKGIAFFSMPPSKPSVEVVPKQGYCNGAAAATGNSIAHIQGKLPSFRLERS